MLRPCSGKPPQVLAHEHHKEAHEACVAYGHHNLADRHAQAAAEHHDTSGHSDPVA